MQRIQKRIREFLSHRGVPSAAPDTTVERAVAMMRDAVSSCVLVVEHGTLIGIFSEHDLLHRVAAPGLAPAATRLRSVMTADPETLAPDDCVSYAISLMASGGFRHVPIVRDGHPLGLLAVRDVISHLDEVFGELSPVDDDLGREAWIDLGGG